MSYAEDSRSHIDSVIEFGTLLRTEAGIDAHVDAWYADQRRDWVSWVIDQLQQADFVLAIASPGFRQVADGGSPGAAGRSRELEAAILRDNLARALPEATRRILPVVLPGRSREEIPLCLQPHSTSFHVVPEYTVDGVQSLLRVLSRQPFYELPPLGAWVPPAPGVRPVVIATGSQPPTPDTLLRAGATIAVGDGTYLADDEHWAELPNRDGSAVLRQARASRLYGEREFVWLRQLELRHPTPAAHAALAGLEREYELVRSIATGARSLPTPGELVRDGAVTTLATRWPASRNWGGPADTLSAFVPEEGAAVDPWRAHQTLRGLAGLCQALHLLHRAGATHRNLTPSGLVRLDDGSLVLTDLGLAASAPEPGEGPEEYRAPEQSRRRSGRVGPWTDVYQVGVISYHLVSGQLPYPAAPVPVHALAPGIGAAPAAAIDAALLPDPARRPGMSELASVLRDLPENLG
ncbi:SEFIR domain-containing protein [Prauserella cavernicola]|uniref:SEFIR domain-containing protein n=1 Tax=Prauserella cavernicola TaxID=2800127 RepID=UPI0027DB935C|nr:SEFIR domain-containing protein [Prauserella cavernicola]